ncbi:cysteine desulfurase-like [Calliopsis andreniformis]|uniref:cysteine desulfurase-like n=1 Tax=Calliopsis andreniformis TaxID=337506 RepID=UPI003FCD05AB
MTGSGVLIFNKELATKPIIIGGGQDKGFRGDLLSKMDHVKELRDQLECELLNLASDIRIFSENSMRLSNKSFIYMPGVKSDVQLMHFGFYHIAVSNGSACSSGKVEPSHVLLAIGATKEQAECSIRISIYPETNPQAIKKIVDY